MSGDFSTSDGCARKPAALAHSIRVRMLDLLTAGDFTCAELAA